MKQFSKQTQENPFRNVYNTYMSFSWTRCYLGDSKDTFVQQHQHIAKLVTAK